VIAMGFEGFVVGINGGGYVCCVELVVGLRFVFISAAARGMARSLT
jgi:hypothetical protein